MGVAAGPVAGGWLLEHFWWGSVFLVNIPIVLVAIPATMLLVPESKEQGAPALDWIGAALSIAAMSVVVFTIIEAPVFGWLSPLTLAGFVAAALLAAFVRWELGREHPLLPVRIFENLRFSAASVAIGAASVLSPKPVERIGTKRVV